MLIRAVKEVRPIGEDNESRSSHTGIRGGGSLTRFIICFFGLENVLLFCEITFVRPLIFKILFLFYRSVFNP